MNGLDNRGDEGVDDFPLLTCQKQVLSGSSLSSERNTRLHGEEIEEWGLKRPCMLSRNSQTSSSVTDDGTRVSHSMDNPVVLKASTQYLTDLLAVKEANLRSLQADIKLIKQDLTSEHLSWVDPSPVSAVYSSHGRHSKEEGKSLQLSRQINGHRQDLSKIYFNQSPRQCINQINPSKAPTTSLPSLVSALDVLSQPMQLKYVAEIDTLAGSFFSNSTSVISGMEFHPKDLFFAVGGVSRKVQVYDFQDMLAMSHYNRRSTLDNPSAQTDVLVPQPQMSSTSYPSFLKPALRTLSYDGQEEKSLHSSQFPAVENLHDECVRHFPTQTTPFPAKISCLSWNPKEERYLAVSLYDGKVGMLDVHEGKVVVEFNEHLKRVWSCSFTPLNPRRFVSGSDDQRIKLWSLQQKQSTQTIQAKSNVCSVQFNPELEYQVAIGCADHSAYIFDLRKDRAPIMSLVGHQRSVSFVKYRNVSTLVTLSVDSTIRQWDVAGLPDGLIPEDRCRIIHTGHRNDKSFVGLSVNSTGDYFACGSETNDVFVYHTNFSSPLIQRPFGPTLNPITGHPRPILDPNSFISAVCWAKHDPRLLLSANAYGRVKVFHMGA